MFNRKLKERICELENQVARLQLDKWLVENNMNGCDINVRERYLGFAFEFETVVQLRYGMQEITEEFINIQELFDELVSKEDYYKFKYDKIKKK